MMHCANCFRKSRARCDVEADSLSTYSYDSQTAKYKWLGDKHLYVVDKQVKAARPEGEIPEFFKKPGSDASMQKHD